ncbi:TPA: hypothetical protein ACI7ID_004429 [Escherichia coli]|nr:hypothetical protein [Escherichia coli]
MCTLLLRIVSAGWYD